jgi:myosin heavy subunit
MSNLVKYDQARNALAACRNVDEIKDISDKSEAMRLYAKQANDPEMEQWAAEIKLRAQRAIGEISLGMEKQKNQSALPSGGKSKTDALADAGISTSSANRYEQLAKITDAKVEELIAKSKEAGKPISVKAVLANTATPKPVKEVAPVVDTPVEDDEEEQVDFVKMSEDLHKQLENSRRENESLNIDDASKEISRLSKLADQYYGQIQGQLTTIHETKKTATYQANLLKEIRLALGVETNKEILPKLRAS